MISSNTGASTVPLYSEVNLNAITLSKPIVSTNSRGPSSFSMFMAGPNREPFRFQLSRHEAEHRNHVVFQPDPQQNGGSKVNVSLSIPLADTSVFEFFTAVDEIVIKHIALHSKEFLKRSEPMTVEQVRAIFAKSVRSKEGYQPFVKGRFDTACDCKMPATFYHVNERAQTYAKMHHSALAPRDSVVAILQLGIIYSINGKVGYCLDISHMSVYSPPPPNAFPFQLGGQKFAEVNADNLWSDQPPSLSPISPISSSQSSLFRAEIPVMKNEEVVQGADGSTFTMDPVTLLPVAAAANAPKRQKYQ